MRVLVVSHAAMVEVNQEPFDALARAGAEVVVVVPRALTTDIRGRIAARALAGSNARLVELPAAIGGYRRWLGQKGIHVILYRGLARAIAAERPDAIFVEEEPHSFAAYQVARAAARSGIPFVVHENQNVSRRLPPPFGLLRRIVLGCAAGVTVRNETAGALVRAAGFAGPVALFPHGVEPARFAKAAVETHLAPPVVGFVGRLVPEKGIMDLVEAMPEVRARARAGSLLVIGDGPLAGAAHERAHALGYPNYFPGALPHEEVPGWYPHMDVVAVPSRATRTWKEQFGRIVIEANAAGVPVVASDSGELRVTVEATGGGLVVPEGDTAALVDALGGLLADAERRASLGRAGRAGVEARFTPAAIGRALHGFLAKVVAG